MEDQQTHAKARKAEYDAQSREIYARLQRMTHKILVMSGKGGVGKSSVAAHLALALAARGKRVGLMDVDLHGPSIPRMLGLQGSIGPGRQAGKMRPVALSPNLEVMSIEVLMGDKDAATIWRGPLKGGVIRQFIADIEWSELDYLVIDSPPGTGDEPLSVAQNVPRATALIVTTPQEISLADVRKSINFCRQVKMEILGLVENMSGFTCPHCGKEIDLFKTGGGERTAREESLRFLGTLPFEPRVVQNADRGALALTDESPFNRAFDGIVEAVEERLAERARAAAEAVQWQPDGGDTRFRGQTGPALRPLQTGCVHRNP
jgi:ATP-binding protein involved in chromosome partitioning